MILVDTSIWVDHLRKGDGELADLLESGMVLTHPFILGELALGNLRQRQTVLGDLSNLPAAMAATDAEALAFIDRYKLFGQGIGYVDAHLLAATQLTPDATLWTRDQRLHRIATALGLARKPAR